MKLQGRVYRGSSGNYWVQVPGSEKVYIVRLRGTLKKELVYSQSGSNPRRVVSARKRRLTDPVTVGDLVTFDTDTKTIESVAERISELSRKSPSSREQHVLVANLATLFCVVSAADPPPNLWILDKFIVVAENQELSIEIIVNKIDLASESRDDSLRQQFGVYERIGYPVHYVSARQEIGIGSLKERLTGKIAAVAGNSGVGKSSLLNTIQQGLKLKTGEVSLITHKGKHTTTQAELIPLFDDGESWLADTPGLQHLDFWEIDPKKWNMVSARCRNSRRRASSTTAPTAPNQAAPFVKRCGWAR